MTHNLLVEALSGLDIRVAGIDPGETTGICLFEGSILKEWGQVSSTSLPQAASTVCNLLTRWSPAVVVMEDYRVYGWKTDSHSWASLYTPRLIGAVEYICYVQNLKLAKQMAQQAKGFSTDDKLKAWGLWKEGQKHTRDAIRHAVYYLLFQVAQVHKSSSSSSPSLSRTGNA